MSAFAGTLAESPFLKAETPAEGLLAATMLGKLGKVEANPADDAETAKTPSQEATDVSKSRLTGTARETSGGNELEQPRRPLPTQTRLAVARAEDSTDPQLEVLPETRSGFTAPEMPSIAPALDARVGGEASGPIAPLSAPAIPAANGSGASSATVGGSAAGFAATLGAVLGLCFALIFAKRVGLDGLVPSSMAYRPAPSPD
jgi:hypothetical protein